MGFCLPHKTVVERTNTYIVKQYFSFNRLSYRTYVLVCSPVGGPFQGATWREHNAKKEGRRGPRHKGHQSWAVCGRLRTRGQQTMLLLFTQETRAPSLYLETVWLSWQLELWATFCRVPSICVEVLFIVVEAAQTKPLPFPPLWPQNRPPHSVPF